MDAKRVLLVDDDPQVQAVVSDWLIRAGHRVVVCPGVEEAQEHLAGKPFDLLLTDVRLGAYNGLQLVIQARELFPHLPIVVMTGYEDVVIRRDAERFGAIFLTKPVRRADLLACLEHLPGPRGPIE
jgi:DNA-binding NtrC family response regulator